MKCRWVAASVLIALAAHLGLACAGDDPSPGYRGNPVEPPFELPGLVFEDTSGRPASLRDIATGPLTLVYIGYTNCPDICPTHYAELTSALGALPPSVRVSVNVVFLTADPERDSPAVLRDWLDRFDRRYVGLRTEPAALQEMMAAFALPAPEREELGGGQYTVSHAGFIIAFTRDGLGRMVYPDGTTAEDWKHDLPLLVEEDWK